MGAFGLSRGFAFTAAARQGINLSSFRTCTCPCRAEKMNTSIILIAVVAGLLALFIAIKIGRFVLKMVFGLVALAMIAAAAWWFFLAQ